MPWFLLRTRTGIQRRARWQHEKWEFLPPLSSMGALTVLLKLPSLPYWTGHLWLVRGDGVSCPTRCPFVMVAPKGTFARCELLPSSACDRVPGPSPVDPWAEDSGFTLMKVKDCQAGQASQCHPSLSATVPVHFLLILFIYLFFGSLKHPWIYH